MKRVFVTGATGFIGANLARRLVRDGHDVHVLLGEPCHPWRLRDLFRDLTAHHGDLRDRDGVRAAVRRARPDWVFHLAVHGAYSWQTDLRAIVETNVLGLVNLVEACLVTGFEALVNTGSSSEYGCKDHAPDETCWLEPNSYYAVTKASATLLCRHTAQATGKHLPTLRLYSVYGPYEEPNRLMPRLVLHGLRGTYPPLASPDVARDYVYIDDVIDAYLRAVRTPDQEAGAVYNVGTGVQTTLRQVVSLAGKLFPYQGPPAWGSMPDREWDTTIWVADNRRICRALGWEPAHTLEAGLRAFRDWMEANPSLREYYEADLERQRAA